MGYEVSKGHSIKLGRPFYTVMLGGQLVAFFVEKDRADEYVELKNEQVQAKENRQK